MTETYIPDERDLDFPESFIWKSDREHPIYIELIPPSLDEDGDVVAPAGIEDYRMVMGTNSLFSISYSNIPDYITMMEEFMEQARMYRALMGAIELSLQELRPINNSWGVLFHPVDQLGVAELISSHMYESDAQEAFENHLARFRRGNYTVTVESGMVVFDLPRNGRKVLTLSRPPLQAGQQLSQN